jgi:DNA-binding CsgD family transcriptional regulator
MSVSRHRALTAHDLPTALAALNDDPDPQGLIAHSVATWIAQGDHRALTDLTRELGQRGFVRPERVLLNAAWSALATGDLEYADRLLPDALPELGESNWSYAAEGALIRALARYGRGALDDARTHAGLAQAGLTANSRDFLLHPTLLLQARLAFHHWDIDAASAAWQQAADLPSAGVGEQAWRDAIGAVAAAAHGRYDQAITHAESALRAADADQIGSHLYPHCMNLLLAHLHRDRAIALGFGAALDRALDELDRHPHLPLQVEALSLAADAEIDDDSGEIAEALAALLALGTHPMASAELQDLIDIREARLRVRINDLTRARVLIDRMQVTSQRAFLEAYAEAETRPSRVLAQISSGAYRWHSQHVEAEMIRARARRREPTDSVVHMWRALDEASDSGAIRPLLDNPMAARLFSHPDLFDLLDQTAGQGSEAARRHLEDVLTVHRKTALIGPESHALSARELEVLRAVAAGSDFSSVARMMVLSRWTVRGHFYNACRKLGVSGREAAIMRIRQIDQDGHASS